MKKLVTCLSIEKNRFGLEVLDRIDVKNDPINWYDPNGAARKGNKGDGSGSGKNTSNPYKHCKSHPTKPNKLLCKDKNGKDKIVAKPDGWNDKTNKWGQNQ